MSYAVITVDKIDKNESNYIHFTSKDQKAWNCNVPELIPNFAEGERYFIDYNESPPKAGRKYGPKYINRARFWKEEDGANTWPDKEPYTGGGGYSGGKSVSKSDYDPEVGKRQTAANCTMTYFAHSGATIDDVTANFDTLFNLVLAHLNAPKSDTGAANSTGSGATGGDAADDGFGF